MVRSTRVPPKLLQLTAAFRCSTENLKLAYENLCWQMSVGDLMVFSFIIKLVQNSIV